MMGLMFLRLSSLPLRFAGRYIVGLTADDKMGLLSNVLDHRYSRIVKLEVVTRGTA